IRVSTPLLSFFFQAEDGIRDKLVTGVQTCALPISFSLGAPASRRLLFPRPAGGTPALPGNLPPSLPHLDQRTSSPPRHHRHLLRSEERRVGKEGRSSGSSFRYDRKS